MKKILAICLAVAMTLVCFTGCGNKEAATWEDQLGTAGKIRVGTSADYPPFNYYVVDASGNVTTEVGGFDIEVANYISEYTGMEVEIVPMAFETIISAVNAGTIDLGIACFSYREDRDVLFSDTYYTSCQAVMVSSTGDIKTLEDLSGKVILAGDATTGMYYAEELCNTYGCEVRSGEILPMVESLKAHACAAIVTEECVATSYMNANPGLFEIINQGAAEEIKVIAKNGNELLMEKVNEAVKSFIESENYDKLVEDYFG
ncbi:MAG: amino acid ABC transporter substrate-binding protein [Eubacteriaceae bacterium]|nr:amino acid ABC transporter substrate-binding protein [Eubacteriaceae bacterium]